MQNGQLTVARVFLSGVLAVLALSGAIWLLHDRVAIPSEYWVIVLAGISGVNGLDLAAWLLTRKEKQP